MPTWLTSLGVAEVIDCRIRLDEVDPEDVALDLVELGLAESEPLGSRTAARAVALRSRHYHRSSRSVSLADCVVAETARANGASVATSDLHLLDLCADEHLVSSSCTTAKPTDGLPSQPRSCQQWRPAWSSHLLSATPEVD